MFLIKKNYRVIFIVSIKGITYRAEICDNLELWLKLSFLKLFVTCLFRWWCALNMGKSMSLKKWEHRVFSSKKYIVATVFFLQNFCRVLYLFWIKALRVRKRNFLYSQKIVRQFVGGITLFNRFLRYNVEWIKEMIW